MSTRTGRIRRLENRYGIVDTRPHILVVMCDAGWGLALEMDRCTDILRECGFLPTGPGVATVDFGHVPGCRGTGKVPSGKWCGSLWSTLWKDRCEQISDDFSILSSAMQTGARQRLPRARKRSSWQTLGASENGYEPTRTGKRCQSRTLTRFSSGLRKYCRAIEATVDYSEIHEDSNAAPRKTRRTDDAYHRDQSLANRVR